MDMELETTGLMQQIQTLIAPPPSEAPPKVKRKETERRRGKGQNRDTCDACGDCGNLICCDKCPAAVHLQCQDPPLEEDDVPLGEWLCRVCKAKANKPKDKKCLEELTPMQMLFKVAVEQNPSMYDIPNNSRIPLPFPGADKGPKKVTLRRGSAAKKSVPEPAKLCFACRRGVRVSSLLNCDYCSSSFHLDCLNPPLTAPPSGTTWMCPNHPEHYLDAYVLKSTSGVERIKLWERAAKQMDEHSLKLEFLRKASRKNPPFKYKVNLPERQKAYIPSSVVQMYKNPIGLVPTLPNHVKYDKSWKTGESPSQTEMEDWLSSLIAMQVTLAWDLNKKTGVKENDISEEPVDIAKTPEAVEDLMEQMFNSPKRNAKLNRAAIEKFCSQLEAVSGGLEAPISKIDPRLIKLLAIQRIQQLIPNFKMNNSVSNSLNHETKVKIKETPSNEVYAAFDENLFLKNGVVCTKKKYVALKDVNGELKVEEWSDVRRTQQRKQSVEAQEAEDNKPPARAALAPIGSALRGNPVAMRFRTLTIGTNPDSDVCLTEFGTCHFTSPKHAVIFFDAMTGEFELLNYSSYGTIVDGCLYCIDSTQCRVPSAASVSDPLTQRVRSMLDKRRGVKRDSATTAPVTRVTKNNRKQLCGCQERVSDPTGWEGSAILYHCSHLQFGCLQFVFSIVDFAPGKNLVPESVERKKKKLEENGGEDLSAIKVEDGDGKPE